jgi:hypothetical protein
VTVFEGSRLVEWAWKALISYQSIIGSGSGKSGNSLIIDHRPVFRGLFRRKTTAARAAIRLINKAHNETVPNPDPRFGLACGVNWATRSTPADLVAGTLALGAGLIEGRGIETAALRLVKISL